MDASDAFGLFVDGSVEAGEDILAISGDEKRHCEITSLERLGSIRAVLTTDHDDEKVHEIAAGIVANLMLFDDKNDLCVSLLNLPDLLYECCTKIDDPFAICEMVRALSNLVYVKKSEYLHASIPTLGSLVMYLSANSLSPRLLTQVVQLVYYIQVYSGPDMVRDLNQYWNANTFFISLLGYSTEEGGEVSAVVDEELYSTVLQMQSERIADCSGVEWLLLSIDRLTVDSGAGVSANGSDLCSANHVLRFVLHLLLSSSLQSWDATIPKSARKTLGVVLSPSTNEKFLVLSILENIVNYRTFLSQTVNATVESDIVFLTNMYSTSSREGCVTLLCAILETMEEAVLMRDKYGVFSAAHLVVQLFSHDAAPLLDITLPVSGREVLVPDPGCSFIVAKLPAIFTSLQNVIELIGVQDNTTWALSMIDQDTYIGTLRSFFNLVDDTLLKASETVAVTSLLPMRNLLDLREVVLNILPSFL